MAKSRKNKRAHVGVLFWVAFILLIAVIFLANRANIQQVLETTGLLTVVENRFDQSDDEEPAVERSQDEPSDQDGPDDGGTTDGQDETIVIDEGGDESGSEDTGDAPQASGDGDRAEDGTPGSETGGDDASGEEDRLRRRDETESEQRTQEQQEEEPESRLDRDSGESGDRVATTRPTRERSAAIYFIRVTDDGKIHPERVRRTVTYVDSPMTRTLQTLLQGPTAEELSLGLLNLIPEDTQLLSARVEDGVAYLNFNEAFRFNPMGVEGLIAQLQQIVFSSTEFSTVDRVQILIEGKKVDYLGEGVFVGEPLARRQFS